MGFEYVEFDEVEAVENALFVKCIIWIRFYRIYKSAYAPVYHIYSMHRSSAHILNSEF
jgi:hypothetical protein